MGLKAEFMDNLVSIILGVVFAFLFYNGIGFALNTPTPLVTVVSCSMYPELNVGDLLVLKGIDNISEINTGADGDVVVYYQKTFDKLIVHRVWDIKGDKIITWGDNNYAKDSWTTSFEEIKGKKVLRIPGLGYPRIILFNLATGRKMEKCHVLYDHKYINKEE
ncbi:MAG: signal peptidase I [Candidatus Aenigmarchaeota archaeon]|nr:signal peptidase I [Candidatus Aenigmarchaeota archaeon]